VGQAAANREAGNSRAQLGYLATASHELRRFPGINADGSWPPDKGIAFTCVLCGPVVCGTTHALAPRYTWHGWKGSQRTFVPPLLRTRLSLHLRTAAPRPLRASQNDSAIQYKKLRNFIAGCAARSAPGTKRPTPNKPSLFISGLSAVWQVSLMLYLIRHRQSLWVSSTIISH